LAKTFSKFNNFITRIRKIKLIDSISIENQQDDFEENVGIDAEENNMNKLD
jgi:hypothetical protein